MINSETCFKEMIDSPVRNIRARVELLNGSALVKTFKYTDALKSFSIERVGEEDKFFGFGVCQKLNVKLLDVERKLNITTANTLDVAFGVGSDYIYAFPIFHVTEVHRNEVTNELSVTAYDALYKAANHTISELGLKSYTIREFTTACAAFLGVPLKIMAGISAFDTQYDNGANFEGTETIREALNAIAEATQTIYYIDNNWELTFKRLDISGNPVTTIDKAKYFSLDSKTNRRLTGICHVTELGDNVSTSTGASGTTQYIRNNPFWDLRDDIADLLNNALSAVGGLTLNQFECDWRGNFLLEIGDKIALVTKDNKTVTSYLLNDTISYDGGLAEETSWNYADNNNETASNPSSLGEAIKQTYARVDKANKQIEMLVSDTSANSEAISSLQINADSISASVQKIETNVNESLTNINEDISNLTSKVEAKMSAEDVKLEITKELANGVDKVTTSTGFTFDEEGLTVEKSGSEMKTQITEDGMQVFKNDEAVLTANNLGVDAVNLHATTYLIIGTNSRFEDWGDRTACFWIR